LKQVLNVDCDLQAIEMSRKVVQEEPNLAKKMLFLHLNAVDLMSSHIRDYDVIFMALMVGSSREEKLSILKHLHEIMVSGQVLFIRTVHGTIREIRYVRVDMLDLEEIGFQKLLATHKYIDHMAMSATLIVEK
jgi:nicotianamine synthase